MPYFGDLFGLSECFLKLPPIKSNGQVAPQTNHMFEIFIEISLTENPPHSGRGMRSWMYCFVVWYVCANFCTSIFADVTVRGHFRKNGTYVQPHHRTRLDGNIFNNYSTKGNYNPYTGGGKEGHIDPYRRSNSDLYLRQQYHNPYPVHREIDPYRNLAPEPTPWF